MPRTSIPDPPLPPVVTRAEALAAGLTRDQIRQRVRVGRWRTVAHGVYDRGIALVESDEHARVRERHLRQAEAAALAFRESALVLHSAAVAHGLPLWRPVDDDVALNVAIGSWNGTRPGVVIHRMTMAPEDVVGGRVPVTSVARTCIDLARLRSMADGLAASDAALRAGTVTSAELLDVAHRTLDPRGRQRGLLVASQADGVRESPAESSSWAYFLRHRVPLPRPQVVLVDHRGAFLGRVDFWWDEAGLVGECDGRMKYAKPDDLYAEKRREDALRAAGYRVIRWTPQDFSTALLATRLLQSIRRRHSRHPE